MSPKLVREPSSNAVLNTDAAAFDQYKSRRNAAKEAKLMVEDVKQMKEDIAEIRKDMKTVLIMLGASDV